MLEVVRAYWALYLERGGLAQKVRLLLQTRRIVDQLEQRKDIDAQLTQLVSARAALAEAPVATRSRGTGPVELYQSRRMAEPGDPQVVARRAGEILAFEVHDARGDREL